MYKSLRYVGRHSFDDYATYEVVDTEFTQRDYSKTGLVLEPIVKIYTDKHKNLAANLARYYILKLGPRHPLLFATIHRDASDCSIISKYTYELYKPFIDCTHNKVSTIKWIGKCLSY